MLQNNKSDGVSIRIKSDGSWLFDDALLQICSVSSQLHVDVTVCSVFKLISLLLQISPDFELDS